MRSSPKQTGRNMIKKNINLEDIKQVRDQIKEEYPGDDVSPSIIFKNSVRFSHKKNKEDQIDYNYQANQSRSLG